jgi:hypothetical protein
LDQSLKGAVITLTDEIDPQVLARLLEQLNFLLSGINSWIEGDGLVTIDKYLGFGRSDWTTLVSLSDRALKVGSFHRRWYNLGQAFGWFDIKWDEFDPSRFRWLGLSGNDLPEQKPDYQRIVHAVHAMPDETIEQILVLRRLRDDAAKFEQLGEDRFFQEVIEINSESRDSIGEYRDSIDEGLRQAFHCIDIVDSQTTTPTSRKEKTKPSWDKEDSTLCYNNETIRKLQPKAKNVIRLLDAFQEQGWPDMIEDPFPGFQRVDRNPQRLSDTIKSLKKNLQMIDFHMYGDGRHVCWKVVGPKPS